MAKTMASLQAFPSSLLPRARSRALIPCPFSNAVPRRLKPCLQPVKGSSFEVFFSFAKRPIVRKFLAIIRTASNKKTTEIIIPSTREGTEYGVYEEDVLSFDANVSSFSLAESPPRDLQITAYK